MRIFLSVLAALSVTFAFAEQAETLSWKMGFIRYDRSQLQSLPFSRPLLLKDGNQFQLLILPAQDAWVDVLYEDTTGTVQVLYQGQSKAAQALILPDEKHNYDVSAPDGTERIHVIVSLKRQDAFEASFKALPRGSAATLDELAKLKNSLLSLAEAPEKPVAMGGTARALADVKVSEILGRWYLCQDSPLRPLKGSVPGSRLRPSLPSSSSALRGSGPDGSAASTICCCGQRPRSCPRRYRRVSHQWTSMIARSETSDRPSSRARLLPI